MSGIDEQDVPECSNCNDCNEWFIIGLTWVIPPKARERRKLVHPLVCYDKFQLPKMLLSTKFECNSCHTSFDNDSEIGIKILSMLKKQIGKPYHTDVCRPEQNSVWIK